MKYKNLTKRERGRVEMLFWRWNRTRLELNNGLRDNIYTLKSNMISVFMVSHVTINYNIVLF